MLLPGAQARCPLSLLQCSQFLGSLGIAGLHRTKPFKQSLSFLSLQECWLLPACFPHLDCSLPRLTCLSARLLSFFLNAEDPVCPRAQCVLSTPSRSVALPALCCTDSLQVPSLLLGLCPCVPPSLMQARRRLNLAFVIGPLSSTGTGRVSAALVQRRVAGFPLFSSFSLLLLVAAPQPHHAALEPAE